MKRMPAFIATAAAVLAFAAGGAVSAFAGDNGHAQPAGPARPATAATTPQDNVTESKFVPIAPCRAVNGAAAHDVVASGSSRHYYIGGTYGFAPQGGVSGGCGVPSNATAAQLSVIAVPMGSADGYLKAWPYGTSEPSTSILTYSHLFNQTTSSPVALNYGLINVKDQGSPVNVFIDVTGYFVKPMSAHSNADGTLVTSSRVSSSSHLGTGQYEVDFDRDVSKCSYTANSYFSGESIEVEPRFTNVDGVYLFVVDYNGNAVNAPFYLTVTC